MSTYRPLEVNDKFSNERLGLVTVYSIESDQTIVVRDLQDRYFRVSGLSLNLREAHKIEEGK